MTDIYTSAQRSEVMAKVRGRDTAIERLLRSALHRFGLRFRLNVSTLPGRPDIVFPRYRTVVFVHGCFWHRHKGCKRASVPQSNQPFWEARFSANLKRDQLVAETLQKTGWQVLVVWECEIARNLLESARQIRKRIKQYRKDTD
jgi:DNA mismatch endonuclease (patch repair protein)